jgi:hypothetical protein
MTPQSNFMVAAPIKGGCIGRLKELLAKMNQPGYPGMADPKNQIVPFRDFATLHYARFVILSDRTLRDTEEFGLPKPKYPVRLAFLGDCDGPAEDFLASLARHPVAAAGLRDIFGHCEGFAADTDLLGWMQANEHPPAAAYVNWIGRTVRQIHEEADLRKALVAYIGEHAAELKQDIPQQIRAKLKDRARVPQLTPPARTPVGWWVRNALHFAIVPAALLLPWLLALPFLIPHPKLAALVVIPSAILISLVFLWLLRRTPISFALLTGLALWLFPFLILSLFLFPWLLVLLALGVVAFLWVLRQHEKNEPEIICKPAPCHVRALAELEDHDVTNQFSLIGSVKPGRFRLWLITVILWLTDYGARHVYNRGGLARIQTIHFARWVFLDDRQRVFFGSNYDGSDEAYMDDFINKVGWGLNLAFASGIGYPRTNWLIKDGAKEEEKFKATNRRHQIATQVWYKAYPDLTAFDLARNARVREGFERRAMTDEQIRTWMRDL